MKKHALATLATVSAMAACNVAGAATTTIHAEGTVSDFMAIFAVGGYNCSQYNPCNPSAPTQFSTTSHGSLALGQRFSLDVALDDSTGQTLSATWTSADGKAKFGGPAYAGSYTDNLGQAYNDQSQPIDGVRLRSQLLDPNGTPKGITTVFNIAFAGGDFSSSAASASSLLDAVSRGGITGITGKATFDACTMYLSGSYSIYAGACTSRMTFSMDKLSINGVAVATVPEPGTWGSMGLGLALVGGAVRLRRRAAGV